MSRVPQPSVSTLRFLQISENSIDDDEVIITASDAEENRGNHPLWGEIAKSQPKRVIWIKKTNKESISFCHEGEAEEEISLRDELSIERMLKHPKLLIDVTGLTNDVWAPVLKKAYETKTHTRILYAEPENYRPHPNPASSGIFDLSLTFEGLSPLPGFARLSGPDDEESCLFIATLGFEGNRPEHLVSQLDPAPKVIPIVGAPGFQLEYPTYTVGCNRLFLEEYRAHADLRYARASCPFEMYQSLCTLKREYPNHYFYMAIVGTKPHAIGTILFSLKHPDSTEIMFDYPIKKDGRTSGIGTIHIYNFERFDAY
ncbi:hypothetical protein HNP46_002039 [Pseudomonas nitritireducens]|uniref:Uncharacterized protein n=1 Tax=Pseudomonas nitroreducens TaxID=46680 RepID=A0A7W7KI18_PSENT|nr:hypothetical protein [Pseudomonas nitritireducens]MBB4863192.1 hypothetical protein [Pseudomonas nitritireducens]